MIEWEPPGVGVSIRGLLRRLLLNQRKRVPGFDKLNQRKREGPEEGMNGGALRLTPVVRIRWL